MFAAHVRCGVREKITGNEAIKGGKRARAGACARANCQRVCQEAERERERSGVWQKLGIVSAGAIHVHKWSSVVNFYRQLARAFLASSITTIWSHLGKCRVLSTEEALSSVSFTHY